uniref:DUF6933 domain-containing protein n=1 Tax=Sporosarcina sp. FSL K6-1522 TaxID=2921554 RepID=UPI00406D4C32
MLMINRRKTVILMHGMKAKDFKQLDVLVEKAIRQVFRAERVSEDVIEQYMKAAGDVAFYKTKNRSLVARLNQACDYVWLYAAELDSSEPINVRIGKKASSLLVGDGKCRRFTRPRKCLRIWQHSWTERFSMRRQLCYMCRWN